MEEAHLVLGLCGFVVVGPVGECGVEAVEDGLQLMQLYEHVDLGPVADVYL